MHDSDASEAIDTGGPEAVLGRVGELATAAEQATLVHVALQTGLLTRCAEPTTALDLADALGTSEERVEDVCTALVALGALEPVPKGAYRLTADWMGLTRGGVDVSLMNALAGAAARRQTLAQILGSPPSYWELDAGSRSAMADSVTLATTTEFGRALTRAAVTEIPELEQAVKAGGSWLELGCGVAGMLLGTLVAYPDMTAVGVDVAPDLLDTARARAERLGVADRVQFVEADATTYQHDKPVDIVFWSQFFFPAASRRAALDNAFARLRPGGLLVCPVLPGQDQDPTSRSIAAQQSSLLALLIRDWAPIQSFEELADEITGAGFADIRQNHGNVLLTMTARRH
ncbi:class I SAM-dependent methyltransferase [Streptomyces sp. NPDC005962]|uniref:SAM-dependent methyltransferase n=1 Tax=Streptomyces sp. NPDC005962 TaxID=3154466 RepID=UPI0033F0F1BA